tara:strand:- start:19360 stop:21369 length:2010 start_codon:yes stop_codon:yes gene_type:complete
MTDVSKMTKVDKILPVADRISFLEYCADKYETDGTSPISDKDYDIEYYALEAIEPNNAFFSKVGGWDKDHIYGTAVPHDVIMGSLSKCPDIPAFQYFLEQNYSGKCPSFVVQHKIDGSSLSLIYDNGKLVRATTRGDGVNGIDITANAVYIRGVKTTIDCKERVEIRGEVYKNRQDFYKTWHTSVGGAYANPRNFTAGSVNQKDAKVTKERGLDLIAYEVVQKDFELETEKNEWLKNQGFVTLNRSTRILKDGLAQKDIIKAVEYYMAKIDRDKLTYDIDGVVVKLNDVEDAKSMGYTAGGRKPKANRAVKFPAEEKETILIGIETNVGRTGSLTPVALLKPVELGGAMISRATLHNFGMLSEGQLKIGARVSIAKKGDIIPQIVEVKKNGDTDVNIPTECPCCGEPVVWTSTKVDLICENASCLAQLNKRIEHWFKKLGVKGFASKTIGRLTNPEDLIWEGKPIIQSLPEMYYMLDNDRRSEHPFRKYKYLAEQLGEKTYDNLKSAVKSVEEVSLSKFIESLGIGQVGTLSKEIVAIAPTIEDIDKLTVDDLVKIDKFAGKKSVTFVKGWKSVRGEIKLLLRHIKIVEVKQASDKFNGKTFCFTGSFDAPTRKEMEAMVPDNGGRVSSVSKKLTALVFDGETTKGKYQKAKDLGVDIISQDDFLTLLK